MTSFLSASNFLLSEDFGSNPGLGGDGGLTLSTAASEEGWSTEATSLRHTDDETQNWYNHLATTTLPTLSGGGTDFEIELTFQWNQLGDGSAFRRIGVAFLGDAANNNLAPGDSYYAAVFFPLQGNHGQLRLLNSLEGSTVTSNVNRTSGTVPEDSSNVEFTLSLTGNYNQDGDLTVAFSVTDALGGGANVLSTTIAAASAFSGEHFGIIGRTRQFDTVDYGSLTIIPEPTTYAALAGVLILGLVIARRRMAFRQK